MLRPDRTISIDIQTKLPPAPKVEPITTRETKPTERPPVPKVEKVKPAIAAKPETKPDAQPNTQPPSPQAEPPQQPQQQPPTSSLSMRQGPIDLSVHGLGGITLPGAAGGKGDGSGTFGGQAPRKPWKPRGDAGDPILGKLADIKEDRFPLTLEGDGYHYNGPSFSAHIAMDGRVDFDEHSIRDFKGLSGGFDITDIAMRAKKQDPYRYEKERFMELTGKLRGELSARAQRDRLEASLASLPAHLESVWADTTLSAKDRRRIVYQMWREASGNDVDLGPAAKKARKTIEAFVRDRLPEGTADAFSDEELRKVNARPGAPKFEPYKVVD
ncbi:MAG TPA: hypothetical protein VHB97_18755 [Polyangia bacterium]|nr:hypothetical protein [Polyangia bacterium]